jgi:hypothetical protein
MLPNDLVSVPWYQIRISVNTTAQRIQKLPKHLLSAAGLSAIQQTLGFAPPPRGEFAFSVLKRGLINVGLNTNALFDEQVH